MCLPVFQFTHPGKGATGYPTKHLHRFTMFQFTHPGKGATPSSGYECCESRVSIHAPWEGCDGLRGSLYFRTSGFNSRTLGRVRPVVWPLTLRVLCFNSRTLGRVRRIYADYKKLMQGFNSRTLGRVRRSGQYVWRAVREFQFTHPGKGATVRHWLACQLVKVSIHAPWEGCDEAARPHCLLLQVSIHAPWEGCDVGGRPHYNGTREVSIHAPWEGCDLWVCGIGRYALGFNSRTLGRVRHEARATACDAEEVSIHAPWEGCD